MVAQRLEDFGRLVRAMGWLAERSQRRGRVASAMYRVAGRVVCLLLPCRRLVGRTRLSGPPAGHPERLVPSIPPTATERVLWAGLGHPVE